MARAEGPTRPPGNGPLRRECLARMWARPRQGTLRFVIWGPSADVLALPATPAPRLGLPQVTPVPNPRSLDSPRAGLSRRTGAEFCAGPTVGATLASPHGTARRTRPGAWVGSRSYRRSHSYYGIRPVNTLVGGPRRRQPSRRRDCRRPSARTGLDPRHPRRQRRVVEDSVHVVDRLQNELRCDPEWPLRLVNLAFRAWAQSRVGATTTARLVSILASHLRPLLVHVRQRRLRRRTLYGLGNRRLPASRASVSFRGPVRGCGAEIEFLGQFCVSVDGRRVTAYATHAYSPISSSKSRPGADP